MRIGQKLSIPLFIIGIGNLIDCILKKSPFIDYILYSAIFFILAFLFYIFCKRVSFKIISLILLLFSLISIWMNDGTNLTSTTLLCFSLWIGKHKTKTIYIYILIYVVSLMLKFIISNHNITQITVFISGVFFLLIIYQHYIHPKSDSKITVICPELDAETLKILQKLYLGCSVKDISDMVYLTQDAVSKRIGRARQTMGAKNTIHLLAICQKKGYIRYNMDNQTKAL